MITAILANIAFELKIRYRSMSSYIYFVMFFALALLMTLAAGGAIPGAMINFGTGARVFVNSPMSITFYVALLTAFNLFIIAPVFGQAICKDFINNIDQIIFSTPLKVKHFLIGRFLGALLFMLFVLSSIPLGVFVASKLPFVLPSMLGVNTLPGYLLPLLTVALPNIFIFGSIFFFIGSRTKKMAPIYITATLLFLLWSSSGQLLKDIDNKWLGTLMDPLGLSAISETIRYWTVFQQNQQIISFESYFLWNRVLWMSIGFVALIATLFSFSKTAKKAKTRRADSSGTVPLQARALSPLVNLDLKKIKWVPVLLKQLSFEFFQTIKSIYFLVIVLAGVGYMFITGTQVGKIFGTNAYPVTYNVLDFVGGTFSLFLLIVITLYTGETVWRDRDLKINQIIDALPTPNGVIFAAKFINMVLVTVLLLTAVLFSGIAIQLAYGYTNFELSQYLVRLYLVELPSYLNLIALTFFFQVVFKNKYLAHGMIVIYYLFDIFAEALGLEHYLYLFNKKPFPMYSDMNGFGHLFKIFHLYNFYWLFLSGVLIIISYGLWHRGTESTSFKKMRTPLRTILTPRLKTALALSILGFLVLGSYLFYQNNVINEYISRKETETRSYDYEKQYKIFDKRPVAQLTSVFANVDIFPEQLKVRGKLKIKFKNTTQQEIKEVLISVPNADWSLTFSIPTTEKRDDRLKVVVYTFAQPIQPNQEFEGDYAVTVDESTIKNGTNIGKIHYNGTFFNNFDYFPSFGYQSSSELGERKAREKRGLPPKLRKPAIDDKDQWQNSLLGVNGYWIDFETVVSTTADQIAIAPGYLQKEWAEGNRRYFHYKMDQKIINFYAFLSGRYEVLRDKWNDVNIEIYYHKGHEYNLQRMVNSTKKSLDYFTKHFGPYQHKQYRIIEFPRYETFAQSFPNTIPFSEGIGFIAKVDDSKEDDIDYPFYITAHELAHQWWPHQMMGANVQGADMLSESLSQYSALMVMEHEYGREKMKKFLQYELDRYLFGRSQETEYENPLYLAESQQYLHYRKGSVVLYSIKDYLGEDTFNGALKETLGKYARMAPPYMTSIDFLNVIKSKATDDQKALVTDLMEKIVIFENRPLTAQVTKLPDGTFKVSMNISSEKVYSDKEGKEEKREFSQTMDVGILGKDEKYIYLKKHTIKSGENKFEIVVKEEPFKAGVDPLNVLIDRNSKDNVMNVSHESSTAKETALQ